MLTICNKGEIKMMFVNSSGKRTDKDEIRATKFIFYGASIRNLAVIEELDIADLVICYADSDEKKWGNVLDGYEIHSIEDIKMDKDTIIISVLTYCARDVLEKIQKSLYKECYFAFIFDTKCVYEMNDQIMRNRKIYKYVHFFNNDKFIRYFYAMVSENLDMSEHLFIIDYIEANSKTGFLSYNEINEWNKQYHNILFFYDIESIEFVSEYNSNSFLYSREILTVFNQSEKIWMHSAWFGWRFLRFVSGLLDHMPDKIRWICHGGEADCDKNDDIYKCVISKVHNVYASMAPRKKLMEHYGIKAGLIPNGYLYLSKNLIEKLCCCQKVRSNINILVGHSAEKFNNQLSMLNILRRFSEQNIKIICPLVYGNREYADQVVEEGRRLFGEKFLPIMDFLEIEDYHKMLCLVDVAVFPMTTRFAGGTTIDFLNTIGKKIYLHDKYFNQFPNLRAISINHIVDMTFSEFIENKEMSAEEKYAVLSKKRREQAIGWKQFLDS